MITLAEYVGVGLGLLYLLLAIREYRSCWIAGGLASMLFGVVFWEADLPMQALLQIYYLVIAVHGWLHWGPGGTPDALAPTRTGLRGHLLALLLLVALSVLSIFLRSDPASFQIWSDTVTSWAGVIATWMVARKVLEAWLYWVLIDLATAALYFQTGLLASSALYMVYAILAVVAWKEWLTHYQRRNAS